MITGSVTSDREAVIQAAVLDASGQEQVFEAVIDTGFTGWLTLPPDFISALGLQWRELGSAALADGTEVFCDVYDAEVLWDGQIVKVPAYEADAQPLVGMELMYGYELTIRNVDGGSVTLRRF